MSAKAKGLISVKSREIAALELSISSDEKKAAIHIYLKGGVHLWQDYGSDIEKAKKD